MRGPWKKKDGVETREEGRLGGLKLLSRRHNSAGRVARDLSVPRRGVRSAKRLVSFLLFLLLPPEGRDPAAIHGASRFPQKRRKIPGNSGVRARKDKFRRSITPRMPLVPQRVTREFRRSTEFTGIPATSPNIPARATATPIKNIPREVTDTRCVEISALTDPSLLGSCAHAKFRFRRRASALDFFRIPQERLEFQFLAVD